MHRHLIALFASCALAAPLFAGPHDITNADAPGLLETMQDKQVVLLDAGKGDARELRYAAVEDNSVTVKLVQNMTMKQSMGGQPMGANTLPASFYRNEYRVSKTNDEGFTVVVTVEDAGVTEGEQGPMADMMAQSLKTMVGTVTTITMDDLGRVLSADTKLPAGADAQAQGQADQMASLTSTVPLPEKPVAPGAVWRQRLDRSANGLAMHMFNTYTLNKIDGDTLYLTIDALQYIPVQDLPGDQLPPGASGKVTKADSVVSGTATLDLATSALIVVDSKMTMTMTVNMNMQGQSMSVDQDIDMTMTAEPVDG